MNKTDYILTGWNGLHVLALFAVVGVVAYTAYVTVKVARRNSRRRKDWREYERIFTVSTNRNRL
tara:strand:+ start:279 stop:470 length:192 start_codon:yes stop_codon:yes gene_type:complete